MHIRFTLGERACERKAVPPRHSIPGLRPPPLASQQSPRPRRGPECPFLSGGFGREALSGPALLLASPGGEYEVGRCQDNFIASTRHPQSLSAPPPPAVPGLFPAPAGLAFEIPPAQPSLHTFPTRGFHQRAQTHAFPGHSGSCAGQSDLGPRGCYALASSVAPSVPSNPPCPWCIRSVAVARLGSHRVPVPEPTSRAGPTHTAPRRCTARCPISPSASRYKNGRGITVPVQASCVLYKVCSRAFLS